MSGRGQGRGLAALAGALDLSPAPVVADREVAVATPVAAPVESPAVEPETEQSASAQTPDRQALPAAELERDRAQPKAARRNPARRLPSVRSVPASEASTTEGPRYLRFEAKTVRMTPEQADELGQVEARLRRAARGKRGPGDELLTWNMIARAGIDLVLREAEAGRLSGLTEDELRASVGLDPLGF